MSVHPVLKDYTNINESIHPISYTEYINPSVLRQIETNESILLSVQHGFDSALSHTAAMGLVFIGLSTIILCISITKLLDTVSARIINYFRSIKVYGYNHKCCISHANH